MTADSNRRQGLSVIKANGLLVLNSVFENTHGTRPSAGIDFEPDDESKEIVNVRVENSQFSTMTAAAFWWPARGHPFPRWR